MAPGAGIDGCRAGWILVHDGAASVWPRVADAIAALPPRTLVAIDMPIGLPDTAVPGGRECDRLARSRLGPRRSSVFSPPPRTALGARTLAEARALGASLTLQALNITPKIAELDAVLRADPALVRRVHEAHPELAFAALADGPLASSKRQAAGRAERRALLTTAGVTVPVRPRGATEDDLLDATALAWAASRGLPGRLPARAPRDACGLPMQIRW